MYNSRITMGSWSQASLSLNKTNDNRNTQKKNPPPPKKKKKNKKGRHLKSWPRQKYGMCLS